MLEAAAGLAESQLDWLPANFFGGGPCPTDGDVCEGAAQGPPEQPHSFTDRRRSLMLALQILVGALVLWVVGSVVGALLRNRDSAEFGDVLPRAGLDDVAFGSHHEHGEETDDGGSAGHQTPSARPARATGSTTRAATASTRSWPPPAAT